MLFKKHYKELISTGRMGIPAQFRSKNWIILLLACFSCATNPTEEYLKETREWKKNRIQRLKSETGWLNLAGLFWLHKDSVSVGSGESNDLVFPEGTPDYWGSLVKKDPFFLWYPANGKPEQLKDDSYPDSDRVSKGSFRWYILKRGDIYGIRLRNLDHPRISKLDSIPSYPVDLQWRKEALYSAFDTVRIFHVPTVAGVDEEYLCPGTLSFRHKGVEHILYPFLSGENFFLIIGDQTSGITTYPGGRFLYTKGPDQRNKVVIDFNRAYNPPCAFSPYSTCPFPPPENRLDLEITAGEKKVHLD